MRQRFIIAGLVLALLVIAFLGWSSVQAQRRATLLTSDIDQLLNDPSMGPQVLAQGRKVFLANCAMCHGAEGRGNTATGVPDLTDQDFLYGTGRASEIEQIVLHGIRSGDDKGWNLAWMPAYGQAVPYVREKLPALSPAQIDELTSYVRTISGARGEDPTSAAAGRELFIGGGGCWDCHGRDAQGDPSIGAPNLTDKIWLRGNGDRRDISRIIREGLHGVSPAFQGRLDLSSARSVAVYVASLHTRKVQR